MSKKEERKIYVINQGGHDYSGAEKFGTLIHLSKGQIRNAYATTVMYRSFCACMKNSTEHDYILLTGLTIMNVIACSIFVFKHKRLNLLLYAGKNRYAVRTLKLSELLEEENI